jgi:hypothetical protein
MCPWLDQDASKGGYFTGAQADAGLQDAALFYFIDAKMAPAFVDRFALWADHWGRAVGISDAKAMNAEPGLVPNLPSHGRTRCRVPQ